MYSQENFTQLIFHYVNGTSEAFNIYEPTDAAVTRQEQLQEVRRFLDQRWWVLHLPEETVCINVESVMKVEIKPAIHQLHGEGVFSNVQRMTPLNRSSIRGGA